MDSPKISIIVPVYRVEAYLPACVESIRAQTYPDLEILLVDDGSPDGCPQLCDAYAAQDPRIRVVHKKNGGLSDARNAGLEAATGEYIGFVDSDDLIEAEMYQTLLDELQRSGADLVICKYDEIDSRTGNPLPRGSELKTECLSGEQALEKLNARYYGDYVVAWNKLYSRKALRGIHFPVGKIHEDQFVAHRIFANCDTVACIDRPLYHYMKREASITNQALSAKRLDDVEALCCRCDFYKERKQEKLRRETQRLMESRYLKLRPYLIGRWRDRAEWNTIRRIDRMFYEHYADCNPEAALPKKLRYRFPEISFFFWRVYQKGRKVGYHVQNRFRKI